MLIEWKEILHGFAIFQTDDPNTPLSQTGTYSKLKVQERTKRDRVPAK